MSEIGTHRQKVDSEKFNQHFEETFRRLEKRPGKSVYVFRQGKLRELKEMAARGDHFSSLGALTYQGQKSHQQCPPENFNGSRSNCS